jgi:hypothetical protein
MGLKTLSLLTEEGTLCEKIWHSPQTDSLEDYLNEEAIVV